MTNPDKMLYVITSGSYSDYGINAVYDSKELAEAAIKGRDSYTVEEYPLNPGETQHRAGCSLWFVSMRRDGEVRKADDWGFMWAAAPEDRIFIEQETYAGAQYTWQTEIVGFLFECSAWARDAAHAVKIANDRRAQWIASGEWDRQCAELQKTFGTIWRWNLRDDPAAVAADEAPHD